MRGKKTQYQNTIDMHGTKIKSPYSETTPTIQQSFTTEKIRTRRKKKKKNNAKLNQNLRWASVRTMVVEFVADGSRLQCREFVRGGLPLPTAMASWVVEVWCGGGLGRVGLKRRSQLVKVMVVVVHSRDRGSDAKGEE